MLAILPAIPIGIGIWETIAALGTAAITWGSISYITGNTTEAITDTITDVQANSGQDNDGLEETLEKAGSYIIYGLAFAVVYVGYQWLKKATR